MSIVDPLPVTDAVVTLDRVSWATFTSLARESRGGRLAYDRGRLEIMSPSLGHENVKSLLCRFIEMFAEEQGIDLVVCGERTAKRSTCCSSGPKAIARPPPVGSCPGFPRRKPRGSWRTASR